MALFHLSAQPISRAAGRSATAAAAYRAGVEITDERTGHVHDYSRKLGVLDSEIILPGGGTADRAEFWNGIEKHHKRGDAVLSREVEVSLPTELTKEERRALAVGFARELADRYGVAADVVLHAPRTVTDKNLEKEPGQYYETDSATGRRHNGNWHAHIMLSACHVSPAGDLGKKAVELDPIHCQRAKIENMADRERVRWAQLANGALERAGHSARVDHRSLADQGIERKPSIHLGPSASAIERRGEVSEKAENHQARQAKAASEVAALIANSQARAAAALKAAAQATADALKQIQASALAAEQAHAAAIKEAEKQVAQAQAQREAAELAKAKQQAINDKLAAAKEKDDRIRNETLAALGKASAATDKSAAATGDALAAANEIADRIGRNTADAARGAQRRVAERHYGRVVEAARNQFERVGRRVQQLVDRIEHVVSAITAAAHQVAKEVAAKLELARQRAAARPADMRSARQVWAEHPENPLNIAKREAQEAATAAAKTVPKATFYDRPRATMRDRPKIELKPIEQAQPVPRPQSPVDESTVLEQAAKIQAKWDAALVAERVLYLKELTEQTRQKACAHVVEHEAHIKAKPIIIGREKWALQLKRFEREDEENRNEWDDLKTGKYPFIAKDREAVQKAVEQRVSDKDPELAQVIPHVLSALQAERERVAEEHRQQMRERWRIQQEASEARKARGEKDLEDDLSR